MEIFSAIQSFLGEVIKWMEARPVVSAGIFTIFGIILSAILDIKKQVSKIVSKTKNSIKQYTKTSNKSWVFNLFNNWKFFDNWFSGQKADSKSKEGFRQEILSKEPQGPLSLGQITTCKQIAEMTSIHCPQKFDPKDFYEGAVRDKNVGELESAAVKYYPLFNKIATLLTNIANTKGADVELKNLKIIVAGLHEMIDIPPDIELLRRQLESCERATTSLVTKIYDPN